MKLLKYLINNILFSKPIKIIINKIFIHKSTINIFNNLFEKSGAIFQEIFVRIIIQPNFDYQWKILLPNKKKVLIDVEKSKPRNFEFSLSYKWNDRPLREVETIVNNFYDIKYASIDIGANHGLRSIYALSLGRPVILFEPNPFLGDFTLSQFRYNNFKNYKLENLGVSSKEGEFDFYLSDNTYESSLEKFDDFVKEIKVRTVTLDDYLTKTEAIEPKIIKIDVEGHELEVLKGAKNTILKYNPSMFLEILQNSVERMEILNLLWDYGYTAVGLKNGIKNKYFIIDKNQELNPACSNYFFTKEQNIIKQIKF